MAAIKVAADDEYAQWLTKRIIAAAVVIDDVNGKQLWHESRQALTAAVVVEALTDKIIDDARRLLKELSAAATREAAQPAGLGKGGA
jgi:hypothetical protein